MRTLECQIFKKIKKLIKRKQSRLRHFESLLLDDEYINNISIIDEKQENLQDILIFLPRSNSRNYDESFFEEIRDIEELKNQTLNKFQSKLAEYAELSNEKALLELESLIEDSKAITSEYFESFNKSVRLLMQKLTNIKHLLIVQNKFKRVTFNFINIQRNLKNLSNIITVDNSQKILISNVEKLQKSADKFFWNYLKLVDKITASQMNPCPTVEDVNSSKCPSNDSSSSSNDEDIYTEISTENAREQQIISSDCFFVNPSSGGTRMDSIEKLKTDFQQLEEKIESFEDEKIKLNQEIIEKKKEIFDGLEKIAEFEVKIQDIESLIEDKLYNFQQRLILLELKLVDNYKNENDLEMRNFIENEINDLKETFHYQQLENVNSCDELIQQGLTFAASIGDVFSDIDKFCDKSQIDEAFVSNIEKLRQLLERPPKFCVDSKGRRFYFNKEKMKIFQDEHYSAHYTIDQNGVVNLIRQGRPIELDDNGEFYYDKNHRMIYIKYYFEDEPARYYIDIHGDRHYKADSEASEYMLINGAWMKTIEGTYERDAKGMRLKPVEEKMSHESLQNESDEMLNVQGNQKQKISFEDMNYIKETVGSAIVKACAATYLHQPSDPLSYFANFLLHHRYTEKMFEARDQELKYFLEIRKVLEEKCLREDAQQ